MKTQIKTRVKRIQVSSVLLGVGGALLALWVLNVVNGGGSEGLLGAVGLATASAGAGRRLLSS